MALEVRHNRAKHTHENEQFRRVATQLIQLFERNKWDGLLIGNPENESFSRFRADAVLLYNYGLIIIDYKNYSGSIKLPPNENEFQNTKWYSETETDRERIEIKAGARFINPFRQLKYYREAMYEIIQTNIHLKDNLNPSRTCAVNIFSGPIKVINKIPGNLPYYKIVQESDLPKFLYDYSSENSYLEKIANVLKSIFPADPWIEQFETTDQTETLRRIKKIDSDVKTAISDFLLSDTGGIMLLESMHTRERDDWMGYILSESVEFDIPQTEVWTHSSRIANKISNRTGITLQSLYNSIYGGAPKSVDIEESEKEIDTIEAKQDPKEEDIQDVVPLRTEGFLDDSALIILHEAHLVTRSLHQSELLRFGSGRLLEDLIRFLAIDKNQRKLICIGDPFSLTYGKVEDSILNLDTLKELFKGEIRHYRLQPKITSNQGTLCLRTSLASSIDHKLFNILSYPWKQEDLVEVNKHNVESQLRGWFKERIQTEPDIAALVYQNKAARKINEWIKVNCLKNGKDLAVNDLLLLNNNVTIPDATGFGQPQKMYNGMYLVVDEKNESVNEIIRIKQAKTPVILTFTKLKVTCIIQPNNLTAELWMLDNYFLSDDHLSKEEQIAFRIFINNKLDKEISKEPFIATWEFKLLIRDNDYQNLTSEEKDTVDKLARNEKVSTTRNIRKLVSRYKKKHRRKLMAMLRETDPYINALFVSFGWATTVHKAVGSSFKNIILNAYQGENRGISNPDYFRWLYSALTSAENIACVANPQLLSPFADCRFEDTDNIIELTINTKIYYKEYKIPEKYIKKIGTDFNESLKGAISGLSDLLESHGIKLASSRKFGDYLTKAYYTKPGSAINELIIAVNNTRAGIVSSARIEKSTGIDQDRVKECIYELFVQAASVHNEPEIEFPNDFRKLIYTKWFEILDAEGWQLSLIESHPNQDVIKVINENQYAKFRLYYTNKGYFTVLSMIEKTESDLGKKIKNWLLNGN